MVSTEDYVIKFDKLHYNQMALDFIQKNPGCTGAYLLSNEKRITKKRFYNTILPTLRDKGLIKEEKVHGRGGRHIKLFIREDNPLHIVLKEFREFEDLYPDLLKKVKDGWQSGKWQVQSEKERAEQSIDLSPIRPQLIFDSILPLFEIIRTYMLRSTMIWSRTIQDKYTREILNFTIFSKLYQMQTKMSEILGGVTIGRQSAFISSIATELSETRERIEIALARLSSYNIKEEVEPISNFVIKIILTEMARQNIYSKSSIYKWNINVIDVEELAKSIAKDNPTRSEVQSELDAIISHELDSMLGK